MRRSGSITSLLSVARWVFIAGALFLNSIALASGDSATEWQIECIAPGRAGPIRLKMSDARLRYALPRGVTSFILHLATSNQKRSFTLENENMVAAGSLSIAISNKRFAADNPKWSVVDGAIAFRRKRFFALSLVGVEAKFVKLTFQVDGQEDITQRDKADRLADRPAVLSPRRIAMQQP